ncbi:immunity protein Imm33 domain-containing protein [Desertivirga xinjiangensis]|uniref:immunity protein Imm33 domain-containing protein n=1 Tax=Desertivirga xinjiangensis TaxID=539206 RepID=UPI00210EF536|nr:DUF2185 domain-containing protein [Pedobacter xinjiangensis]
MKGKSELIKKPAIPLLLANLNLITIYLCWFKYSNCLEPGGVIRFLYRETADEKEDSGWRMFSGLEDDEYANNPENITIMNVGYLLDKDPTLSIPLKSEKGAVYEREDIDKPWKAVDDWHSDDLE